MIYSIAFLHCAPLLVNGKNSANALCNLNNQEFKAHELAEAIHSNYKGLLTTLQPPIQSLSHFLFHVRAMRGCFKTHGLDLWQRENKNRLICQKFQIEACNSTEAKTETGSYIIKPLRAKKWGVISPASQFQLVPFSKKEFKVQICRMIQIGPKVKVHPWLFGYLFTRCRG